MQGVRGSDVQELPHGIRRVALPNQRINLDPFREGSMMVSVTREKPPEGDRTARPGEKMAEAVEAKVSGIMSAGGRSLWRFQ